jgi:hypothetical protein
MMVSIPPPGFTELESRFLGYVESIGDRVAAPLGDALHGFGEANAPATSSEPR